MGGDEDPGPSTGGSPTASSCPEPTGPGTDHSDFTIDSDETWTAADSPHYVTTSLSIVGATVTIEKCALVVLSDDVVIEVGDSVGEPGALVARGVIDADTEEPVVFTSESETGYWGKLWVDQTGFLDLEGTILHRGGSVDTNNQNGTIVVYTAPEPPLAQRLRMVASAIVESAGIGVALGSHTGFTDDSNGVVIEDVGREEPTSAGFDTRYPILTSTAGLATIPPGAYTGNYYDAIQVDGGTRYPFDVTIHDRGVPYDFVGDLHIEPDDDTPITLTIEAGSTLRFRKGYDATSDARFGVQLGSGTGTAEDIANPAPVRVIAEGTAEAPITFTSAEESPAAGDWIGVIWGMGPSSGNVMSHVTIDYAGADSGNNGFGCSGTESNAALLIRTWRPDSAFIEDSTFSNSLLHGIIQGWDSTSTGPDLTGNNTFEGNAGCDVVQAALDSVCDGTLPICY